MHESSHVVLVGPMASGKTTVGRLLAGRTRRPLLDSDHAIEADRGGTGAEIAATWGLEALHRLEWDMLVEALAYPIPAVIAAAASVADHPDIETVVAPHQVVHLDVTPEIGMARGRSGPHRRSLTLETSRALSARRTAVYERVADVTFDTSVLTPGEIADRVLEILDV